MPSIFCCFSSKKEQPKTPVQEKERYVHVIQHAASDAMVAAPAAWRDMDQSLVKNELLRHQLSRQGSRTDLLSTRPITPSRTPSPGQSPVLSPYNKRYSMGLRSVSDGGRGPQSSTSGSYSTTTRSHLHKVTNHSDGDDADNEASPSQSSSGSGSSPVQQRRVVQKEKLRAGHRPWAVPIEEPFQRMDPRNFSGKERLIAGPSSDSGFASSSSSMAREREFRGTDRRLHAPTPTTRPTINDIPLMRHGETTIPILQLTTAEDSNTSTSATASKSSRSESSRSKTVPDSDTISEISTSYSAMSSSKRYIPHRTSFSRPRPYGAASVTSVPLEAATTSEKSLNRNAVDVDSISGTSMADFSGKIPRKSVPLRSTQSTPHLQKSQTRSSPRPEGRSQLKMPPPPWMVERSVRSHQLFTQPFDPQPMPTKGKQHMYDPWINTTTASIPTFSTRQVHGLPSPALTEESAEAQRSLKPDLPRDISRSPLVETPEELLKVDPLKNELDLQKEATPDLANAEWKFPEAVIPMAHPVMDTKADPIGVSVIFLKDGQMTPEDLQTVNPLTTDMKAPQIQVSTEILPQKFPAAPVISDVAPGYRDRKILQRDSFSIIHPAWDVSL